MFSSGIVQRTDDIGPGVSIEAGNWFGVVASLTWAVKE